MSFMFSCVGLMLALTVQTVAAADTTDLSIRGNIAPAACDVQGDLSFNFDVIPSTFLKVGEETYTDSISRKVSVNCSGAVRFAFKAIDNQRSTAYGDKDFGLGLTEKGAKIGRYTLLLNSGPVGSTVSTDGGVNWSTASLIFKNLQPEPLYLVGYTPSTGGTDGPDWFVRLDLDLEAVAWFAPAETLDLTDNLQLQGEASIELVYL